MPRNVPYLNEGDTIAIVSPAKAIDQSLIEAAKTSLENQGFSVMVGEYAAGQHNYFSGTIHERLSDFQDALDDPSVKAILCARGGYGCIQLVNKLNWTGFIESPKWIIGFSDVTVFHQKIQSLGIPSLHSTMPLNFADNSSESLETLFDAIKGGAYSIVSPAHQKNVFGNAEGIVVGGNLSILYSLLGSDLFCIPDNSILFVEDLAEQLYHIDRMFHALENSGALTKISGLIVGGMTDLKDTEVPYGLSYEEIILSHCTNRSIPIAFNFPAGHINDNQSIVLGKNATLAVTNKGAKLSL